MFEAPSEQELDSLLSDWSAQDHLTDLTQNTGIARVTLPSLLAIHPDKFDRDSAYESLATLWGVRLSLDESQIEICDAVRAVELECLPGRGDWSSIERFNRPGVLVLSVGAKSIRLVLQSIEDDVVTVRLSGTSYEMERSEIDQYWNGQYMVFWKPPPVDSEQLVPGRRGAAVIWLRQRLDLALRELGSDGLGDINNPEYNQALFNGVRAFQRGIGLESDGIAGRDTLMVLSTYLEKDAVPSL